MFRTKIRPHIIQKTPFQQHWSLWLSAARTCGCSGILHLSFGLKPSVSKLEMNTSTFQHDDNTQIQGMASEDDDLYIKHQLI